MVGAGESVTGESCGSGVKVLDGGGLLSDFVACCLFLSYCGRKLSEREEFELVGESTNIGLGAGSL
jgi:hypothetical protein